MKKEAANKSPANKGAETEKVKQTTATPMKKISDLNSDQFLELITILDPMLPKLMGLEMVQWKRGVIVSEGLREAMRKSIEFEDSLKSALANVGVGDADIQKQTVLEIESLMTQEQRKEIFSKDFFDEKARLDKLFDDEYTSAGLRDSTTILSALKVLPNKSLLVDALSILSPETTDELQAKSGVAIITLAMNHIFKNGDFQSFLASMG